MGQRPEETGAGRLRRQVELVFGELERARCGWGTSGPCQCLPCVPPFPFCPGLTPFLRPVAIVALRLRESPGGSDARCSGPLISPCLSSSAGWVGALRESRPETQKEDSPPRVTAWRTVKPGPLTPSAAVGSFALPSTQSPGLAERLLCVPATGATVLPSDVCVCADKDEQGGVLGVWEGALEGEEFGFYPEPQCDHN